MKKRILQLALLAAGGLIAGAAISAEAQKDVSVAPQRYEAREHYRFNLGGPSGEYTDWERLDLPVFEGLSTRVQIDKTYGKASDKWASLARVNFFGAGSVKDRRILSLMFTADRKTNHVTASIYRSKELPQEGFDVQFDVGKPIDVTVVPGATGKLVFSFGKTNYEVPCDFEIKALSVVGSGIDVKFDPFNLLRRVLD